jgi:xanthine dehydrogenase iron-sulfur cluster and FAD-binding subunit A
MGASPAADAPPVLMALGATVTLTSAKGTREVPVDSFFVGYRQTACRPEELLSRVSIPLPPAGDRQCFYKVGTRLAQSISKVCVACRASLPEVARYLEGRHVQGSDAPEVMAAAGSIAAREIAPIDDVRSSAAYRSAVTRRLVVRFLQEIARS